MKETFEEEKCVGCVMLHFDCVVYEDIPEMIKRCPCHKCIVKVTCSYDCVCDAYSKFQDKLYSVKAFRERIEEYDRIHLQRIEEEDLRKG